MDRTYNNTLINYHHISNYQVQINIYLTSHLYLNVLQISYAIDILDLSQYLGHILVETVKPFFLLLILQIPVGLDSESSYGFDFGYKILQCS